VPIKIVAPKPGRTPYFRLRGTYLNVRVDRSTGNTDRRFAVKALAKIKQEIERGALSVKTGPTFAEAMTAYLSAGGNPRFLQPLLAYWGEAYLADIDQIELDRCAAELYPGATPATRNRQVYTPVSAIRRHAGLTDALRRPKGARGARRVHWLRPDDAAALLAACEAQGPRFGALCTFLLYTGSRLSEGLALDWADVDLTAATAYSPDTKTGEPRLVHLPPVVVAGLAGLPGRSGPVFGYAKSGHLYKLLHRAEAACGVIIPQGISFHIFRHTYGTWMRRAGADLVKTGAWRSRQAADVYDHLDGAEHARLADMLPTRAGIVRQK